MGAGSGFGRKMGRHSGIEKKKRRESGFETPIVDPRIAMSRSDLKLKLQNQISIFTTIKTYLD